MLDLFTISTRLRRLARMAGRYSDFGFAEGPSQSGMTGLDRYKEENNGRHDEIYEVVQS